MRKLLIGIHRAKGFVGEIYALVTVGGEIIRQPFWSDDGDGWCCTSLFIDTNKSYEVVVVPSHAARSMYVRIDQEQQEKQRE